MAYNANIDPEFDDSDLEESNCPEVKVVTHPDDDPHKALKEEADIAAEIDAVAAQFDESCKTEGCELKEDATSDGLRPGAVQIDGLDGKKYRCYLGDDEWNGWACPYFTKDVADQIMADLNEIGSADHLEYDKAADKYIDVLEDAEDEDFGDEFEGGDVQTVDGMKHLYAVGAYNWTWLEAGKETDECLTEDIPWKDAPLASGVVGFDSGERYDCYLLERHWNGWACPLFTKEVADQVMQDYNDSNADAGTGNALTYDAEKDAYIDNYYKDAPEIIEGKDMQTVNGVKHLYAIGAFYWTWDEYARDEVGEDEDGAVTVAGKPNRSNANTYNPDELQGDEFTADEEQKQLSKEEVEDRINTILANSLEFDEALHEDIARAQVMTATFNDDDGYYERNTYFVPAGDTEDALIDYLSDKCGFIDIDIEEARPATQEEIAKYGDPNYNKHEKYHIVDILDASDLENDMDDEDFFEAFGKALKTKHDAKLTEADEVDEYDGGGTDDDIPEGAIKFNVFIDGDYVGDEYALDEDEAFREAEADFVNEIMHSDEGNSECVQVFPEDEVLDNNSEYRTDLDVLGNLRLCKTADSFEGLLSHIAGKNIKVSGVEIDNAHNCVRVSLAHGVYGPLNDKLVDLCKDQYSAEDTPEGANLYFTLRDEPGRFDYWEDQFDDDKYEDSDDEWDNATALSDERTYTDECLDEWYMEDMPEPTEDIDLFEDDDVEDITADVNAAEQQLHESAQLNEELTVRPGKVSLDGVDGEINCYLSDQTWNGWKCPYLEKDEADRVIDELNSMDAPGGFSYDSAKDTYVAKYGDEEDADTEEWEGMDIDTPDGKKHVYPLGAYSWTWVDEGDGLAEGLLREDVPQWMQNIGRGIKNAAMTRFGDNAKELGNLLADKKKYSKIGLFKISGGKSSLAPGTKLYDIKDGQQVGDVIGNELKKWQQIMQNDSGTYAVVGLLDGATGKKIPAEDILMFSSNKKVDAKYQANALRSLRNYTGDSFPAAEAEPDPEPEPKPGKPGGTDDGGGIEEPKPNGDKDAALEALKKAIEAWFANEANVNQDPKYKPYFGNDAKKSGKRLAIEKNICDNLAANSKYTAAIITEYSKNEDEVKRLIDLIITANTKPQQANTQWVLAEANNAEAAALANEVAKGTVTGATASSLLNYVAIKLPASVKVSDSGNNKVSIERNDIYRVGAKGNKNYGKVVKIRDDLEKATQYTISGTVILRKRDQVAKDNIQAGK